VLSDLSVAERGLKRKSAKYQQAVFLTPKTQFGAIEPKLFDN